MLFPKLLKSIKVERTVQLGGRSRPSHHDQIEPVPGVNIKKRVPVLEGPALRYLRVLQIKPPYRSRALIGMECGRHNHPDGPLGANNLQHPFGEHTIEVELAAHDRTISTGLLMSVQPIHQPMLTGK